MVSPPHGPCSDRGRQVRANRGACHERAAMTTVVRSGPRPAGGHARRRALDDYVDAELREAAPSRPTRGSRRCATRASAARRCGTASAIAATRCGGSPSSTCTRRPASRVARHNRGLRALPGRARADRAIDWSSPDADHRVIGRHGGERAAVSAGPDRRPGLPAWRRDAARARRGRASTRGARTPLACGGRGPEPRGASRRCRRVRALGVLAGDAGGDGHGEQRLHRPRARRASARTATRPAHARRRRAPGQLPPAAMVARRAIEGQTAAAAHTDRGPRRRRTHRAVAGGLAESARPTPRRCSASRDLRERAGIAGYDVWPLLAHELAGVAWLQWPWSARAMDEAGAALDRLQPDVCLTYAEAGGWGRAIVLEARRRRHPKRRPAARVHLPSLAQLPARAGRDSRQRGQPGRRGFPAAHAHAALRCVTPKATSQEAGSFPADGCGSRAARGWTRWWRAPWRCARRGARTPTPSGPRRSAGGHVVLRRRQVQPDATGVPGPGRGRGGHVRRSAGREVPPGGNRGTLRPGRGWLRRL